MVTEAKTRLLSAFPQRRWLWREGDCSLKPPGTHSSYFHHDPSPKFWDLPPFLLAPKG